MPSQEPDLSLVARARHGARDAVAELVERHHAAVRGYLWRYLRTQQAVDDLAQDVFLAAVRGLDEYRGEAPVRAWLLAIARRQVMDHLRTELRRRGRHAVLDAAVLEWQLAEAENEDDAAAEHERRLQALARCLARLPRDTGALLSAYYRQGQTTLAIARRVRRTEGAVRMALMRARQALRACIEERLAAPPGSA